MLPSSYNTLLCLRPDIETEPEWWKPLLAHVKVGNKQAAKTIRRSAREAKPDSLFKVR